MIKHLFKLIWNKKKQNALLIVEMLVSFLVVFAVFTGIVYCWRNYLKPVGIDYKPVLSVVYHNEVKWSNSDSMVNFYETLRRRLESMPEVEAVGFHSSNIPFTHSMNGTGLSYKGQKMSMNNIYTVEDSYKDVFKVKLLEGRWLNASDDKHLSKRKHMVINETLKAKTFGNEPAVGKTLGSWDNSEQYEVVGVVEDMKDKGSYTTPLPSIYTRMDTSSFAWVGNIFIRTKAGAGAAFESRLYRVLAGSMRNATISIGHFDAMLADMDKFSLVPMIIALIVAGFLIVNVALGLFGVLWYNINKRRGEIGLRRAIGATGSSVSGQLVGESMIVATMALFIGVFFGAQFAFLRVFNLPAVVYVIAMVLAVLFIYLLVLMCSLYPGKQAAAIYPAVALHEE